MIASPQEHPIYFAKVFHCVKVTTLRIGLKATKLYLPTSPLLRNVILVLFLSLRKYDTLNRRKKEVKMENPGSSFLQLLFQINHQEPKDQPAPTFWRKKSISSRTLIWKKRKRREKNFYCFCIMTSICILQFFLLLFIEGES